MKNHSHLETVGSILNDVLAAKGYLAAVREAALIERWPELAGERIAAVSVCEKAEDGIVYVRVASASWRQELVYLKQILLDKIKKECSTIHDVVFF